MYGSHLGEYEDWMDAALNVVKQSCESEASSDDDDDDEKDNVAALAIVYARQWGWLCVIGWHENGKKCQKRGERGRRLDAFQKFHIT